jgi:hypothetical protein
VIVKKLQKRQRHEWELRKKCPSSRLGGHVRPTGRDHPCNLLAIAMGHGDLGQVGRGGNERCVMQNETYSSSIFPFHSGRFVEVGVGLDEKDFVGSLLLIRHGKGSMG